MAGTVWNCWDLLYSHVFFLTILTITSINVLTSHHKIQPRNYHLALSILTQHIFTLKTQNIIIVAVVGKPALFFLLI